MEPTAARGEESLADSESEPSSLGVDPEAPSSKRKLLRFRSAEEVEQTAAHGEESMGEHEVSTGETAAASKMDVEVSLVDTAPLADAEETFKSPKSIRSVKSVLSRDSNKSSGEQAVDRPSAPLKVEVVVISFPDAEEAEATVSPIEDPETPEEMQIAAPSGGTLRTKDTAGLPSYMTLSQRLALSMARHPRRNLSLSLLLTLLASAIGVLLSPFKIETSNLLTMYMTRGTEMSNRVKQSQTLLSEMSEKRFSDQRQKTNQVKQSETLLTVDDPFEELVCGGDWYGSRYVRRDDIFSCVILHIHLQMFHFSKMVAFDSDGFNLVAMWGIDEDETKQYPHEALDMNASASLLDADSLFEMCREEQHVLQVLEDEELCYKCSDGAGGDACIQPFSLVGLARAYIKFSETASIKLSPEVYLSPTMTCQGLREAWKPTVQSSFSSMMRECTLELLDKPSACSLLPPEIVAPLVDQAFADIGELRYSTSIYATKKDSDSIQRMYELELSNMLSLARNLSGHSAIQSSYEVGIDPMYTTGDGGFGLRRIYKAVDLEYSECP